MKNLLKKSSTLFLILNLSFPLNSFATASFGQASDLFNVGAGARSMAMGGAFTGLSDDASASYFNPSGLAFLDEHQLMMMHAPLMLNTNYNYFATAHPFGDKWGSFALSDALLMSDKFEQRDSNNNLQSSNASLSNNALLASYAHKLPMNMSFGVNTKFIQQKIVGHSGTALGLDLGFMYRPNPLLSMGLVFDNLNSPEVKLDQEADVYRPVTKLGLASEVFKDRLTLTADLIRPDQEDNQYAAGLEYKPHPMFSLRGGFNTNRSFTAGLGVNLKQFRIDYAFSNTDLGAFNKVSFTWAWHNIYKTTLEPPMKEGRAVFPLTGFENQVAFMASVPDHSTVAHWDLLIKDKEGKEVRKLEADLKPPEKIVWDARNSVGEPIVAGDYSYTFLVKYQNGKSWTVAGNLNMALPDNKSDQVIDMKLDLNGAKDSEEEIK